MKIITLRRACSLSILFASLSLLGMASAQAETVRCTAIGALPATITVPGLYCLFSDRTVNIASGAAITINSNDVVLDLNDHTLTNSFTGQNSGVGVYASQRSNITIRNGTLRGFSTGIRLFEFPGLNTGGHVFEDMLIEKLGTGQFDTGIAARGKNIIVRNNHVIGPVGKGIRVDGPAPAAIGNIVDGATTGIGFSEGLAFSTAGLAQGNRITNSNIGIDVSGLGGKYLDNLTIRVTTPYATGTYPSIDAGNNN